ncbi:Calcium-binding EF-hand family protein [Forsythia ovata]|uniref:Calcium-binding EF-hand family protein n=1 Tax=Forsythia ovata TaxID=205694 RepID=A0ABD1RKC8_9LAMI
MYKTTYTSSKNGHTNILFKKLDENGDGILDFNEVLAFYYMDKTGIPSCKELLLGPYFSCAMCLGKGSESYDLCCDCYSGGDYSHEHSLDNFMDTRAQLKPLRDLMKNA